MRAYLAAFLAILVLSVAAVHPKARFDPNDSLSFRQRAWGATGALLQFSVLDRYAAPGWHLKCSGVAVAQRKTGVLFITAGHCPENGNIFKVTFAPDESGGYPATLLERAPEDDLSLWLVNAPANRIPIVPIGSEFGIANGTPILSISYPGDLGKLIRTGYFIAPFVPHYASGLLQTALEWSHTMPIDLILIKGMSGGPLFDEEQGTLIGVTVGRWAEMPLAEPASRIRILVNKYLK